jgi:uncharacterized protein (DUF58 family)
MLLLLATGLVILAGRTASLALFAVAVGIAAATVVAGVAVAVAARRVRVTRHVSTHEAVEGEAIRLRFDVGGLGWLPVRLEAALGRGEWAPLASEGGTVSLTVGRRGAHLLEPSPLRLRDALGIVERRVAGGEPEPLLILPAPDLGARSGARTGALAADAELDGLQPYLPGTPVSRIHWPTVARGAGMHARRLVAPPTGLPLVVVDTAGTTDPRAVDWAARTAAGHILALIRRGGCRVLLPGDRTAAEVTDAGAQWLGVHRRLATLTPGEPPAARADRVEAGVVNVRAAQVPAGVALEPARLPPGVVPAEAPA